MPDEGYCECGCGERTALVTQTNRRLGRIKGQPSRYINHHNPRRPIRYEIEDRGHDTPCWIWQGSRNRNGYGYLMRDTKNYLAHVWFWRLEHGDVPDGLELDHLCRVRECCNPTHLEPVTHRENVRRGSRTKLTPEQVREIRASATDARVVAARFGIARNTVYSLRGGRRWPGI